MDIQEFKEEFINNYFDIRESEILRRVNSSSRAKSNVNAIKSQLNKALSLVFSSKYMFFDLPLIGTEIGAFYQEMLNYRASQIESTYFSLEEGKSDFNKGYAQMFNAEKNELKVYAAIAMGLKNAADPEADEYASDVLTQLQASTNQKLGKYFVYLRSFTQKVIIPLKNEILSNEETTSFMEKFKVEINFDDNLGEIISKLDELDAKAQKLHNEGLLERRPKLSLSNEIAHFLEAGKESASQVQ